MHRLLLAMILAVPALADVPGIELVKPEARKGLEQDLGVDSLDRLPTYQIDQAIDDVSGTLSAKLTLTWTNLTGADVSELPLQLHPNAAKEMGTNDTSTMAITEVASTEGPQATFEATRPSLVTVKLAPPLANGARVVLTIRYNGKLRQLSKDANDVYAQAAAGLAAMSGAGVADYGLVGVGDGILTMASAYPMVAPFREGSFDTGAPAKIGDIAYNGQAVFVVRSIVPAGMRVITNLVDSDPKPAGADKEVVSSQGAIVRDFLLVAGRDLEESTKTVGGARVRSVYRKKDAKAGKSALDIAAAALESYERRFGAYPYTELDVAEASLVGGAGGVEFPAMVLIAGMLYRDPSTSGSQMAMLMKLLGSLSGGLEGLGEDTPKKKPAKSDTEGMLDSVLEFTVEHEVAHEYFAIEVGNDCHRHPCVDEPLAQYLAGLAYGDRHGAEAAKEAMDKNVKLNYALYRVMGGADKPAARAATEYKSTTEYAGLVYGKAPYLYVSLAKKLGEEQLHSAMREAVARCRFRLMTVDGWEEALGSAAGDEKGVRAAFQRWFQEAHGDEDLGVSDDGEFVLDAMFGPDVAASLKESLPMLGMEPKDFLKSMFGGGLGDDAGGKGIDPDKALKELEDLLNGK